MKMVLWLLKKQIERVWRHGSFRHDKSARQLMQFHALSAVQNLFWCSLNLVNKCDVQISFYPISNVFRLFSFFFRIFSSNNAFDPSTIIFEGKEEFSSMLGECVFWASFIIKLYLSRLIDECVTIAHFEMAMDRWIFYWLYCTMKISTVDEFLCTFGMDNILLVIGLPMLCLYCLFLLICVRSESCVSSAPNDWKLQVANDIKYYKYKKCCWKRAKRYTHFQKKISWNTNWLSNIFPVKRIIYLECQITSFSLLLIR